MAILQGVVEGLEGALSPAAAQENAKKRADRRATSQEEVQAQAQSILTNVKGVQDKIASLGPNPDPKQLGEYQSQLHTLRQDWTDLFHPKKNPGNLGMMGKILQAFRGQQGPTALTADRMAQGDVMGAPAPAQPKSEKPQKESVGLYLKDAQGNEVPAQIVNGKAVPIELPPGMTTGTKPVAAKTPTPPRAPAVGTFGDFLIQAYGPRPTAQQIEEGKRLYNPTQTTVGTHEVMVPQPDGTIKAVTVQTTSAKSYSPVPNANGKSQAKPAGQQKKELNEKSRTVGGKMTSPQAAAEKKYDDAVGLSSLADQVSQKPDDAINQKRLAVALERLSAGRFTTQALDYIIKAGWGNTLKQWANNPKTGALPTDVMRQLVDGAKQNLVAAKAERDAAFGSPGSGSSSISDDEFLKKF